MFNTSDTEILSSNWALSPQHAQVWLLSVANILKRGNRSASSEERKRPERSMQAYVIDEDGNQVGRQEQTPQGSIGIVIISGPMIKYGNWYQWGSDELVQFARNFDNDPNIIGQIWVLDSGGGSVTSIAPYLNFLAKKKKPVVGLADTCASANYYVGSTLDRLYAGNNVSSLFGSIGTVATIYDYREYLKNLGVEEHMIYATQSTHKHKSYHEALEGNYENFRKEHLDPITQQFQNHVKSSRPNLQTDVEGIISGKVFYAQQALEYGMIDGISDLEQAMEQVRILADARSFMNE